MEVQDEKIISDHLRLDPQLFWEFSLPFLCSF